MKIDPEKLAISMKGSKSVAWPESWRAEDFAWVARQVAETYGSVENPEDEDLPDYADDEYNGRIPR